MGHAVGCVSITNMFPQVFGPVMAIFKFTDDTDAIRIVNSCEFVCARLFLLVCLFSRCNIVVI